MARKVDTQRHDEVIASAFVALQRRGVVGVSMADLAADLGMSRSALYWYFDGLPSLFEQALAQLLTSQGEAVAAALDGVDHPVDALAAWMRATVGHHHEAPERLAALLQLWAVARPGDKDPTLQTFAAIFEPMREAGVDALRAGVAEGKVAPCDTGAIFDLCAVVVDGSLVHRVSRGLDGVAVVEDFIARVLLPLRRPGRSDTPTPVKTRRSVEQSMAWD